MIRDNPKMVVGMCRGIAKAVHFGLANPDAAVRLHWKLYPQSKPQGSDEARPLSDSRRVFMSRFADYATPRKTAKALPGSGTTSPR